MAANQLPEMPVGPVLELHGQRKHFHIPQGLKLLLEECSREVLRNQPENIYEFLADFLEDRAIKKELEGGQDGKKSWQWRRWSWDGSSLLTEAELIEFLSQFKISIEAAQHLAIIIQAAYRGFMGRRLSKEKKEERQKRQEALWEEWRHEGNLFVSAKDVQDILAYYGVTLFEANIFATKIQALFRGHLQRSSLEKANPELAQHLKKLGISSQQANKHATMIQSAFRGFKARKELKDGSKPDTGAGLPEDWELLPEGADFTLGGTMADAKKRYETSSVNKITKTTGAEAKKKEDAAKPKYDAFFPEGYQQGKAEVVDGIEVPPKFTHEHFGEIDPKEVRSKISSMKFQKNMSRMFTELNATKEERMNEQKPKQQAPAAPEKKPMNVKKVDTPSQTKALGTASKPAIAAPAATKPAPPKAPVPVPVTDTEEEESEFPEETEEEEEQPGEDEEY